MANITKEFIDSSIFLGSLLDKDENCLEYLDNLGYKAQNIGFVSNLAFGEILFNLVERFPGEEFRRLEIFKILMQIIDKIVYQERLKKVIIKKKDFKKAIKIMENPGRFQASDALLLASAINNNCDRFVTKDPEILKSKRNIMRNFGIEIFKV